jgi:hypothetical protein
MTAQSLPYERTRPVHPPWPLCDDFPLSHSSRTEATMSTKELAAINPIPLCDLRGLCAMIFPLSHSSRTKATMSTKSQLPFANRQKRTFFRML